MNHRTTKAIRDLQDNKRYYAKGSPYPTKGVEVTPERLAHLESIGVIELDGALKDLTVPELKELAQAREIEGYSELKKADLIKALEE